MHHTALVLAEAQPARAQQMLCVSLASLERLVALQPGNPADLR